MKDVVLFRENRLTEADIAMVARIREITSRGSNVEIRKKGEGYSILEVRKKVVHLK